MNGFHGQYDLDLLPTQTILSGQLILPGQVTQEGTGHSVTHFPLQVGGCFVSSSGPSHANYQDVYV